MPDNASNLTVAKSTDPTRTDEWSPFETLRREVDRLFENFHTIDLRLPTRAPGTMPTRISAMGWQLAPAMDLVERSDVYEITAELPGLNEKDVEIKLSNHSLIIKGQKNEEKDEKQKEYYHSERRFGSFQRSFQLPDGIDTDMIEASFAKGVLTVRLPKTTEARNAERAIVINAA